MSVNIEIRAQVGRVSDNDNGTADVEVQLVAGKHVVIHTALVEMVRPFAAAFRVQAGALALADMLVNGADPEGERTNLEPEVDEAAEKAAAEAKAQAEAEAAARAAEAEAAGAKAADEGAGDEETTKAPAKKKAAAKKKDAKAPVTPPE